MVSRGSAVGAARASARLSRRSSGEIVPSDALYWAHGHYIGIVTNDLAQGWTPATQDVWGWRPQIEAYHREEDKQLTGVESCQCRRARIMRNHIGCAMLVWVRLKQVAHETGQTIYQVKHGLLSDCLQQQLRSRTVCMALA